MTTSSLAIGASVALILLMLTGSGHCQVGYVRHLSELRIRELPRYREGLDYVAEANKLASFLGRAYCVSCGLTGLYFMLGPIVKIGVCRWHGTTCDKELPMPMK